MIPPPNDLDRVPPPPLVCVVDALGVDSADTFMSGWDGEVMREEELVIFRGLAGYKVMNVHVPSSAQPSAR